MDTPDRKAAPGSPSAWPSWSASGPLRTGLVLIVLGAMFLLQRTLGFGLDNWWAIFIAIPGAVALFEAYRAYERAGRRATAEVARLAMAGAVPLTVAAIFLFRFDWGTVWPVFLILAGLGALTGGWRADRS